LDLIQKRALKKTMHTAATSVAAISSIGLRIVLMGTKNTAFGGKGQSQKAVCHMFLDKKALSTR
jgi:hypothetical protein